MHYLTWVTGSGLADTKGHAMARTIRAARSASRTRVWLVPEKTSMSPALALRTCTTIGPSGAFWSWLAPAAAGAPAARVLAAAAAGLSAPPSAVTASPAAPAVADPRMIERRDGPSAGGDWVSLLGMTILSGTGRHSRRPHAKATPEREGGGCGTATRWRRPQREPVPTPARALGGLRRPPDRLSRAVFAAARGMDGSAGKRFL